LTNPVRLEGEKPEREEILNLEKPEELLEFSNDCTIW
jgi:hypothetical protein